MEGGSDSFPGNGHWCEVAQHYYQKSEDVQKELDEYTEASSGLEKELETALEQKEKLIKDLRQQNHRLDRENELIKKKMERLQQENGGYENDIRSLKCEKERHCTYIRELEQKNDDLERAQRVISESVVGIEALLNQAYERNAVLESEVDEMENLRVKLQRLSDEARDLQQELDVKEKLPNGNISNTLTNVNDSTRHLSSLNGTLNSSRFMESETQTNSTSTPLKRDVSINGNTMTPSARISALNIVGDLLRKVGLEKFLCPQCDKVKCVCEKSAETLSVTPDSLHCIQFTTGALKSQIHTSDLKTPNSDMSKSSRSWLLGLIPESKSTTDKESSHINNLAQLREKPTCINLETKDSDSIVLFKYFQKKH